MQCFLPTTRGALITPSLVVSNDSSKMQESFVSGDVVGVQFRLHTEKRRPRLGRQYSPYL